MHPILKCLRVVCAIFIAGVLFAQSAPPTITTSSPLPDATVQTPYSVTLSASGGVPPYSWTVVGSLPPGLSLSSAGTISGTPTQTGSYSFTVNVFDVQKAQARKTFSLAVQASTLAITSLSPLPNGALGVAYSFNFDASGGVPPYTWSTTATLPPGLSLSPGGSLTGTPTSGGAFTFTIQVSDYSLRTAPGQVASKTFTLRITAPLSVTTPSPINATAGSSFSVVMEAAGGAPLYIWSVAQGSQLPPGFTLDNTSGFLTGTPTTPGTYNFTVQAFDSAQGTATKALVLIVQPPVAITTASPATAGAAGANYSLTLAASGGNPPYTWALESGTLPAGVTLNPSTGVLSGTPQDIGSFSFVIRVTDSVKASVTKPFSLPIRQAAPGLLLSVDTLDFNASVGGDTPAPQRFSVNVASGPALQFTIQLDGGAAGSPAPGWLLVRLVKGLTPSRVPVAVEQTGLEPGKYTARILINTNDNRQSIVNVTLTVTADPPQLDVSPPYLRFAGALSVLSPVEQRLLVRNTGGGGPLAFIAYVAGDTPWLTVSPSEGQAGPREPALLRILVNAQGLAPGAQSGAIHVETAVGAVDVPVSLLVRPDGAVIGLDAAGVRFDARGTHGSSDSITVNVLNLGDGAVNWTSEILSGSEWLSLQPSSGQAAAGSPSPVKLSSNSGALAPGAYYSLIRFSDPNTVNGSLYLTAVLNLAGPDSLPFPRPDPIGLFFIGRAGNASPPPQTVRVFTSSSPPAAFQASAETSDGGDWLSVTPSSGSVSTQSPAQVSVAVNPIGLKAGVYTGEVTFALSTTLTRSANVTFIVQPSTVGATALKERAATGCAPTRLAVTQTGLTNNFAAPAGWPSTLAVRLADDCGDPVLNGQVVTTFSSGDPAVSMRLTNPGAGIYSATWSPARALTQVTVTARASAPNLTASNAELTGSVTPNKVPILAPNGTRHDLNPIAGAPLAPGAVARVSGANLATVPADPGVVPLPTAFNGTRMLVGAFEAPLYSLSDGELKVQIPVELKPNSDYPVVVEANGGYTLPDSLTIIPAQPGVASSGNRLIALHGADFSPITPDSPATQGEAIIISLVGMGATDPPVPSGTPAPSDPLASVIARPSVTVGGQPAEIIFAGLTPAAVGLYQIQFTVPSGQSGDLPVVVTQNGVRANTALLAVQ